LTGPAGGPRRRIAIVCEVMHAPFDEGIRIFAAELARSLRRSHDLLLISERDSRVDDLPVHGALGNRWFLSTRLARLLGEFAPVAVVYVSWTSLTSRAIVRCRSLRRYARGAQVAVVALQPRPAGVGSGILARLFGPDLLFTAGPAAEDQARRLGIPAVRIAPGVDSTRFRPAAAGEREALRRRAGLAPDAFVVLHVGHLKESRNVATLERIAALPGVACMLVASSSTLKQTEIAARLSDAGVVVVTHHQERIEFAYRLADAYLFPVTSPLDAIEMPLSVLEAAATDLAIVATPFGSLPGLFEGAPGPAVAWAPDEDAMVEAIARLAAGDRAQGGAGTRRFVERLTWEDTARRVAACLDARSGEQGA